MLSSYGNQLKQIGYLIFKKQLRNIFFTEDICYFSISILVDENPQLPITTPSQSPPNRILTTFESRNHFRLFGESRGWRKTREKYKNSCRSETTLAKFSTGLWRKGRDWNSKENEFLRRERICFVKFQGWTMTRSVVAIPRISRFEGNGCLERLKASAASAAMRVHSTCESWETSTRSLNLVYFLNPWFRK